MEGLLVTLHFVLNFFLSPGGGGLIVPHHRYLFIRFVFVF